MLEADLLTFEAAGAEGKQPAPAVAYQRPGPGARQRSAFGFGEPPRRRPLPLQAPRQESIIGRVSAGGKKLRASLIKTRLNLRRWEGSLFRLCTFVLCLKLFALTLTDSTPRKWEFKREGNNVQIQVDGDFTWRNCRWSF